MPVGLNYSQPERWYLRQRFKRFTVGLLICAAMTVALIGSLRLYQQVRRVESWRHAIEQTQPPTTVVFDSKNFANGAYHGAISYLYHHRAQSRGAPARGITVMWGFNANAEDGHSVILWNRSNEAPTFAIGSRWRELSLTELPLHVDRLYAGQPDPNDDSHFTIRYELAGKGLVIDGWLMPDDTVKLEPRIGLK